MTLTITALSAAAYAADEPEPQLLPAIEITAPATALPAHPDELPSSSTRVERDALADAQYQVNLSEALGRVPGLVINNRHNYAQDLQISLRGFGARSAFGVRGIRLYTDGIPATMPDGQGQVSHFDLPGTQRVTVLRGPFSALYGSSAGGVIELTSREPDAPLLELTGWNAAFDSQRYGLVGGTLGEAWSALGSGSWFETDGYRRHSAARRGGGQARLAFDLGGAGDLALLANAVDVQAQDPLGLTRAQWQQNPRQPGTNAEEYDSHKSTRQSQAGLSWTRPLGESQGLRAVAWAGQRQVRQFLAIPDTAQGTLASNPSHPGGVIDLDRDYYGMDLRWLGGTTGARPLRLTFGMDLEFLDERRQGFQNFTGEPGPDSTKGVLGPQRRDEDNRAQSIDPYTQADWAFAPDWTFMLGLRHAHTRFTSEDRFLVNGDDSGSVRYRAWLPVAGLRYAPGSLAVHAAVSRGSETPTLNELAYRPDGSAGLNTGLRDSRSTNIELGASFPLPASGEKNSLTAELAVFRTGTTDEIVVAGSSGGRTSFRNATATTRNGVEASLRWQILPTLGTTFAYTWVDARYDDAFCPGASCPPATEVPAGSRLPGVPRHNLFGELVWRSAPRSFMTALEGLYRGDVSVNDAGTEHAPAYAVLNLRTVWTLPGGLQLMARADNLLDRQYAGSVIVNQVAQRYFEPAPGRTFGAGLQWTWGP
jgi:iron complex outermembrane recepter protein